MIQLALNHEYVLNPEVVVTSGLSTLCIGIIRSRVQNKHKIDDAVNNISWFCFLLSQLKIMTFTVQNSSCRVRIRHGSVYNLNSLNWQGQPTDPRTILYVRKLLISHYHSSPILDIMKSKSNPDILKMAAAAAKRSERTMRSKVGFHRHTQWHQFFIPFRTADQRCPTRVDLNGLLPSSGHMRHCMLHCTPAVALLTGSIHRRISCIFVMQQEQCGVCAVTHTCWCDFFFFFPPLLFSVCESWHALGQLGAAEDA